MSNELCSDGKKIWEKMINSDDNNQIILFIKHLLNCKTCRVIVADKFIIIDEYFAHHPDLFENINSKLEQICD